MTDECQLIKLPCRNSLCEIELAHWKSPTFAHATIAIFEPPNLMPSFIFRTDSKVVAAYVAAFMSYAADPSEHCYALYDNYWVDEIGDGIRRNLDNPINEGLRWVPTAEEADARFIGASNAGA